MDSKSDEMIASKVYPKDSFDRFGDDLCELLLSYLSFKERFRYECVAKQWQTLIFTTQTDLIYNFSNYSEDYYDQEIIEYVLKKCPNITTIEWIQWPYIKLINGLIDLVIKHCDRLHTFCVSECNDDLTVDIMDQFFAKFAKQLKIFELSIRSNGPLDPMVGQCIDTNIKFCYQMCEINYKSIILKNTFRPLLEIRNKTLYPKLQKISVSIIDVLTTGFDIFVDNYRNQLKAFDVFIWFNYEFIQESFNAFINGLLKMHKLIDLKINSYGYGSHSMPYLGTIGRQLKQLKSFSYNYGNDITIKLCKQLLQTIVEDFKQLKRLSIAIHYNLLPIEGLVLPHLTHLTLHFNYFNFNGLKYWDNIDINLPKLQCITAKQYIITDGVLNGLSLVPKLRYIRLKCITDYYTKTLFKNLMDEFNKDIIDIHHKQYMSHLYYDSDAIDCRYYSRYDSSDDSDSDYY